MLVSGPAQLTHVHVAPGTNTHTQATLTPALAHQHTRTKVRQLFCFSTLPTRSTISVGRQTLDSTEKRELGNFVVRDYYLEIFGEN